MNNRNEELKKKYLELFKKLKAKFTDENLMELSNYDYHLEDSSLLSRYTPVLRIDTRGRVYEQLELKQDYKNEIIRQNNLEVFGATNQYNSKHTLDDIFTNTDDRKNLVKTARLLVKNILTNTITKGLYIYGKNRVGKTYLAKAIANEVVDKKKVIFVFLPDFIRQTLNFNDRDNNLESNIKNLKECDVLILDDLGAGIKNHWFRDAVLLPVIQERLVLNKVLICTSNFDFVNLINELANDKYDNATMADRDAATRITARITEMCRPYKLENKGE